MNVKYFAEEITAQFDTLTEAEEVGSALLRMFGTTEFPYHGVYARILRNADGTFQYTNNWRYRNGVKAVSILKRYRGGVEWMR